MKSLQSANLEELLQIVKNEADQCVRCGLCLPHCPTYRLSKIEGESPRGRIALMKGMAENRISVNSDMVNYLDHCLTCRACEVVCPAHVEYGQLIDDGRQLLNIKLKEQGQVHQQIPFILDQLTRHPRLLRSMSWLLVFYQRSGLEKLCQRLGILKLLGLDEFNHYLPDHLQAPNRLKQSVASAKTNKRIGLFTGCVTKMIDQQTLHAAVKLLNSLGFEVIIPAEQVCCSAMHLHAGEPEPAKQLISKNLQVFADNKVDRVISVATGCGAVLAEYPLLTKRFNLTDGHPIEFLDINQFLVASLSSLSKLNLKPLRKKVLIQLPCSLRNVIKASAAPEQLLQLIPQLEIQTLTTTSCCGAAGTYMMNYPDRSQALVQAIIDEIIEKKPDIIVSPNIGCSLHIRNELRKIGVNTPLLHPIALLAQQIP